MKRAIDAYRRPKQNRQRIYTRAFVVAARAQWAKRLTYKSFGEELGLDPKQLNYLLNAPLHVICKDCEPEEAEQGTNSQSLQMNGEEHGISA